MQGMISWLVLVAVFAAVAGLCGIVTARLFGIRVLRRRHPGKAGGDMPPEPLS